MPLIGCLAIKYFRMKKSHLSISILILLISLSACKSSIKKSDTIVSPEGNVLRKITDPEDSITHNGYSLAENWVFDVNNGAYRFEHTNGAGSGQIVITDRKDRLHAAYGYNQCEPQIAKVCYENDKPSKLILIWLGDSDDYEFEDYYEWNDVGKMFDKLLKGEVKAEKLDSLVISSLTYDNTGHIIEVRNPVSGECLKAPEGCCISSKIEETGALAGTLDFSFQIRNTIRPVEK
jgi:hypothetical protein